MDERHPSEGQSSILGLERHHTVFGKLFLTAALLILGPLIGMLFFLAINTPAWQPPWAWIVQRVIDVVQVFYVSLLVFVWWRPGWLQRHYFDAERSVVRVVLVFFGCAVLFIAYQIVWDM